MHSSVVAKWPTMWSMKQSKTNPEQLAREDVADDDDGGSNENEREKQVN